MHFVVPTDALIHACGELTGALALSASSRDASTASSDLLIRARSSADGARDSWPLLGVVLGVMEVWRAK